MNNIYISPHSDDICYSLGAWVASNPGGHLINVYTQSNYMNPAAHAIFGNNLSSDEISQIRRQEDQLFADATGLILTDLFMKDAPIDGYSNHHDLTDLNKDIDKLEPVLMDAIISKLQTNGNRLFCPIAAGMHRNHTTVLMCIIKNISFLKNRFDICFYEEIPYSRDPDIRRLAYDRLTMLINNNQCVRVKNHMVNSLFHLKENLVKMYQSQLKQPFDPCIYWQGWKTDEQYESWIELI
jgi:hypothetical protein